MVSTKRQIRRDDDRYGGFSGSEASLISDYDILNSEPAYIGNSMLRTDTDYNITNTAAPAAESSAYTAPVEAAAPTVAPQNVEVPAPPMLERPKKPEVPHSREDVLPTIKTRSYATEQADIKETPIAEETKETAKRRGLSSRERIMLCVYVAIALILAVAVIATGVSISAASVQSDALSAQIEQNRVVIAAQENELAALYNEDNIRGRATQAGMVQAGESVYNAPVAETAGYPQATPHTNGFDEFMDWLSHILN